MKQFIIILLSFSAFTLFAQSTITKQIGDFSVLKVYNGIEAELIKSDEQKIEISGKKSEMVKIKNVNGTLKLSLPFSLKPKNNAAQGQVLIKLYYKTNIDIIDANEGAIITAKEFEQNKVEVKTQERAFINLVVTADNIVVKSTSGGIVKLSGSVKNQKVKVDLYGIYHGYNLAVSRHSAVNAGTGAKAEIMTGDTLTAKVSFGGSIFYKGNPKNVKEKKVVGGVIQKRK